MRVSPLVIGVALVVGLGGLVVIGLRSGEPVAPDLSAASGGPAFEVRVRKPLSAQPLFGFFGLFPARDLTFGHASPGARTGRVGPDRLELVAEGWDLSIEAAGEETVGPGTRLVFRLELAGSQQRLRCRPAVPPSGYLRTAPAGPAELGGRFRVELPTCENDETGKTLEWPPHPLIVVGSFDRLPSAEVSRQSQRRTARR